MVCCNGRGAPHQWHSIPAISWINCCDWFGRTIIFTINLTLNVVKFVGEEIYIHLFIFWIIHDDIIKWKHFPRYWPFVRGIHRLPVNSPHEGQWRGALKFSLICSRINGWENNREAGDLRRNRAHYNVIVMSSILSIKYALGFVVLCVVEVKSSFCEFEDFWTSYIHIF